MARIGIVSPAILPNDATGCDVRHMGRILRARGHEVGLFSTTWGKPQPRDDRGVHILDFLRGDPASVLILHHAIGWEHTVSVTTAVKCRRVIKYHNITPASFYDSLDADVAAICRLGREQLRFLVELNCDLYLSDSDYNLQEMLEMGADPRRCAVVSPFNALENMLDLEGDEEVLHDYGDGCTNVLFVGRRVPNKGHRFLIDAFAAYQRYYNVNSRLILIGKGDPKQGKYTQELRDRVQQLGLRGSVVFRDSVTDVELRAYYERASAFLITSEHEGFCVPLVEAMAFRVPIVAYGTTAVPHTIGSAGLVWDNSDPFLLAQSLDALVRDPLARGNLIERGWQRYRKYFTNERIERDFLDALQPLAL